MPGLDPGIHDEAQRRKPYRLHLPTVIMDCRVKPGNDNGEGGACIRKVAERVSLLRTL
jgi:hypothetical protein